MTGQEQDTVDQSMLENIPAEMRRVGQWIVWKLEGKTDTFKGTKVPRQVRNPFQKASTTDPGTWGSFGEAVAMAALENLSGVGYVFQEGDGIVAIDLDNCIEGDGQPDGRTREILGIFGAKTYIELSHSRMGYHILCRGTIPPGRLRGVEIYNSGRYFAMTGEVVNGCTSLGECQAEIDLLFQKYGERTQAPTTQIPGGIVRHYGSISDNYGLRVEDIGMPVNAQDRGGGKLQGGHPFHGSTTGHNFTIDTRSNVWYCFRDGHRTGGDALVLFAVREGIVRCEDVRKGCLDGKWPEVFAALERAGYRNRNEKTTVPSPGEDPGEGGDKEKADIILRCARQTCTDDGNALRLVERYGSVLRYDHTGERWLLWDGARWAPDRMAEITERARDTARSIAEEARSLHEAEASHRYKWAGSSLAGGRIAAMLALARSDRRIAITSDVLDRDPLILNTPDGTVDLKTGELRPHRKEDMVTRITTARYIKGAACPIWEDHIRKVTRGDAELVAWLQVILGYSLLGINPEMHFYVAWGKGKNGKSVTFRTITALAGDYGAIADPVTFEAQRYEQQTRDDLLQLRGARFVFSSETQPGRRLAENLIKNMTGGDALKKRALYESDETFFLPIKVVMASNYKPQIRDLTVALWERIKLIPFLHYFPEDERDQGIEEKLRGEGPGILQWLLVGLRAYWEKGVPPCRAVKEAVEDYRTQEEGDVGQWLHEECVEEVGVRITRKEAYTDFKAWCEGEGVKPISTTEFREALVALGAGEKKIGGTWYWLGIRFKTMVEQEGQQEITGILSDQEYERRRRNGEPLTGA